MNPDASNHRPATPSGHAVQPLREPQTTGLTGAQRLRACRPAGAALVLTFALALAGCGGGSDGTADVGVGATPTSGADTSSVVAVGSNTATAASATTTPLSSDTTCGNTQLRAELIAGINALRASQQSCGIKGTFNAAAPLTWNARLFDAAAGHSTDMASRNYFSHVSPEGQTMEDRVNATGYAWTALAENIAAGQTSVANVLSAWMASPGHCVNIMGAAYQEVALSCARSGSGTRYWTLNLGHS